MKKNVLIIGGGIVGLMTAFFLNKQGQKVTVVDQGDLINNSSASFGNAGLISSFEKMPLACPGVVTHTLKLMVQGKSPVKFHPTLTPLTIKWLWKFVKSTSKERLKKTLALFEKYGNVSIEHYKNISKEIETDFHHDGLIMVYSNKYSFKSKCEEANDFDKYKIMDLEETKTYLPFVNENIKGSVLLKRNAWLDPGKTVMSLYNYLKDNGVDLVTNEKIVKINVEKNKITSVCSRRNTYEADDYVLATGADLSLLTFIKRKLLMLPAKGYSITFEMDESLKPSVASLFGDEFIAFTPRKDNVRLTSIMEIGNKSLSFVEKEMDKVLERFKNVSVDFEMKNIKKWTGLRPLTPNDMPLIGRDEVYNNFVYATGLGWMGITFGPVAGEILANLIVENKMNKESDDILLFSGFYQAGC